MIVAVADRADPAAVARALAARGLWVRRLDGAGAVLFAVEPHSQSVTRETLLAIEGVAAVAVEKSPHPLVDALPARARVGAIEIGDGAPAVIMAGPCAVESEAHARESAAALAPLGVRFLRGGAFKPRSSPYAFQGHGVRALAWLRRAADEYGLAVVTEALAPADVPAVAEHADLVQIGSRNMQDFALLRAVGASGKPALLKRGMAATVEEWLLAAEYVVSSGSPAVVFCERGLRTFDRWSRNLLDLGAVALLARVRRLPVIADPSHAAGRRELVLPLARAAIAAGAHGLLVETHADPGRALSDGPQALSARDLAVLVEDVRKIGGVR